MMTTPILWNIYIYIHMYIWGLFWNNIYWDVEGPVKFSAWDCTMKKRSHLPNTRSNRWRIIQQSFWGVQCPKSGLYQSEKTSLQMSWFDTLKFLEKWGKNPVVTSWSFQLTLWLFFLVWFGMYPHKKHGICQKLPPQSLYITINVHPGFMNSGLYSPNRDNPILQLYPPIQPPFGVNSSLVDITKTAWCYYFCHY